MPKISISPIEVKKFFGRLIAFVIIGVAIIATTILVAEFGPPDRIYGEDAFNAFPSNYVPPEYNASRHNVLLDQHSHTIWSDGVLTPEQNIIWHIKHGFNAAVITDHNNIQGAQEAQRIAREKYDSIFKVIIGEEWTTSRIHLNFLGLSSVIIPGLTNTDDDIKAAIGAAHDQGALVTVNHIPWSLRQGMDHPSRAELVSWGIDFIEMVNENEYDNESEPFLLDPPCAITGTDMHAPADVHGWTALWVPEFTEQAIMAQLAIRNTTIIYNHTGSRDYTKPPMDNPAYLVLKPVVMFGNLFEDIATDSTLTLVLGLSYLFGAFFVAEALRIVKRRYWAVVNAKEAEKRRKKAEKAA
nr:PHP domain-containing protein [Candidatus Sigynarchaeum springense]